MCVALVVNFSRERPILLGHAVEGYVTLKHFLQEYADLLYVLLVCLVVHSVDKQAQDLVMTGLRSALSLLPSQGPTLFSRQLLGLWSAGVHLVDGPIKCHYKHEAFA